MSAQHFFFCFWLFLHFSFFWCRGFFFHCFARLPSAGLGLRRTLVRRTPTGLPGQTSLRRTPLGPPLRRTFVGPSSSAGASQDVRRARMCVVKTFSMMKSRRDCHNSTKDLGNWRTKKGVGREKNSAKFWHPPRPPSHGPHPPGPPSPGPPSPGPPPPGPPSPGPPFALQPPHPSGPALRASTYFRFGCLRPAPCLKPKVSNEHKVYYLNNEPVIHESFFCYEPWVLFLCVHLLCLAVSARFWPCLAVSGRVRPCPAVSGRVRFWPCLAVSGRVPPSAVLRPCPAVSGRVRPCRAVSGLCSPQPRGVHGCRFSSRISIITFRSARHMMTSGSSLKKQPELYCAASDDDTMHILYLRCVRDVLEKIDA